MADSDGVVFTGSAADRIADAVRWVERHRGRNTQSGEGEAPSPPVVYARLTSGDADGGGHYPAVITLYSASDAAWNDYSAVKVTAPNGETLANGTRYAVRPVGRTAGGDELYATLASVAAGATLARIKDNSGLPGGYWHAALMSWNAATNAWAEGDTVVVYAPGDHGDINLLTVTVEKIYEVYPLNDTLSGTPMYYLPAQQVWVGGGGSIGRVVQGIQFANATSITFGEVAGAAVATIGFETGYADLTHDGMVSTTTQTFGGTKVFPGGVDVFFLKCGTAGHNGGLSQPDDTYFQIDSLRTVGVSFVSRVGHQGSLSEQVPFIQFNSGPSTGPGPPDYYSITLHTPRLISWDTHMAASGVGKTGTFGDYTFVNGICTGYSASGGGVDGGSWT